MKRIIAILGILFLASELSLAHKVDIFVYVEGDVIYTESSFSCGKKVEGGIIEVYDSSGNKLLEGVTNKEGSFNFKLPKRDDLRIVLIAPMGHRASYILSKEEVESKSEAKKEERVKKGSVSAKGIIAGVGCIFGIFGIILYLKKRRLNAHQ